MDPTVSFVLFLVLLGVSGVLIQRWWAVILAPALTPLFYVGVRNGWWGYGLGDGWEYGVPLVVLGGLACAAVGVVVGRVLARRLDTEGLDPAD